MTAEISFFMSQELLQVNNIAMSFFFSFFLQCLNMRGTGNLKKKETLILNVASVA